MFADACAKAAEYSRPVVISTRHQDKSVSTECGTFIVLNDEGWIMTAGHMFDSYLKYQADLKKVEEIRQLNDARRSRPGSPSGEIKVDSSLIINHSFWWGWDGVRLKNEILLVRDLDLAVGRLEPFDPEWVREYPVLCGPDRPRPGTSVCRSGYPFMNIMSTWDEENRSFHIPPLQRTGMIFPNEGMHTRNVMQGKTNDGNYDKLYVETSTPGLRGQSGGPIYDRDGHIYAMQVQTRHMPLGFHPTVEYDGRTVVENQFLNVGLGIHVRVIRQILDEHHIRYRSGSDSEEFRIVG